MTHPLLEQLNDKVFTVSEYLDLVNSLLTPLAVEVEGEVTDLKVLPQWTFFSLKDAGPPEQAGGGSLLRCGLHSGQYRRIGVNLEEGMQVKVYGYGKLAAKSGNFGFWVSKIEPVGEGALRRAYELLVKKLGEEGMFVRKRPLPSFITHIGVVSSKNGVVLQDLRQNLDQRGIQIDFVHSGVEGPDSARELLCAIEHFSQTNNPPQVLVLIRGGGSLESLQGFNNEAVCRALFAAPMPVLVGIGHDVDAPIATLVADWSASTPTAVAHVINDSWAPLTEHMPQLVARMLGRFHTVLRLTARSVPSGMRVVLERFVLRLQSLKHRTELASRTAQHAVLRVVASFERYEQVLRYAWARIPKRLRSLEQEGVLHAHCAGEKLRTRVRMMQKNITDYERLLVARDPRQVLARGYGLVYGPTGRLVRSVHDVRVDDTLKTRLHDGVIETRVTNKEY